MNVFIQSLVVEVIFGGGEANVTESLSDYGLDAAFVPALPAAPRDSVSYAASAVDVSRMRT